MSSNLGVCNSSFWHKILEPQPLAFSSQAKLSKVLGQMTSEPEQGCVLALHRRKVVGIATCQDLLRAMVQHRDGSQLRLSQVVTRPVITLSQADLHGVAPVLEQFARYDISYLPIVDDQKRLVGLINKIDLLQTLQEQGTAVQLRHPDHSAQRFAELTQANWALQQDMQALKQIEVALGQSEAQLRLIINNLPVLIAYVDDQQCYRFNNQAYEYWLGQTPEAIHGLSIKALMESTDYQTIQTYIETALAGNQVTYESELTFKDGRRHGVSVTYIPHIEDGDGDRSPQVKGFFALTMDISDRRAIERMKDDSIAVVSHELRTPLTALHGALKLIATGRLGHLSEEGQQMLDVADENIDRLVRLVNNVLDLQRIESGEVTMDAHRCDAADLILQAAESMQAIARQQGIEIHPQLNAINIWADPDYIVQVLTNLIGNAIKFSTPGHGIKVAVQPYFESAWPPRLSNAVTHHGPPWPAMALFCVQDQGQGIPTDQLNSIFERFQQVDSSDARKKGGTGLGLTICRKVVEQHGGQIWAESQMGVGSCFYFTVPLIPPSTT